MRKKIGSEELVECFVVLKRERARCNQGGIVSPWDPPSLEILQKMRSESFLAKAVEKLCAAKPH